LEGHGVRAYFDTAWRTKVLAGDTQAIQLLADAAIKPLFSFCLYRVGRNRELCEEVVQETLVRAIREIEHYDPARSSEDIFPWLTGLARNEIHRVLARQKHTLSLELLWASMDRELLDLYAGLDSEEFSDAVLAREETRELVNATMSQLPPHYRQTLEAKYVRGRSVRDIAHLFSLSEKAVESQLTRSRQAFRATFLALARNLESEARS
jgi:RNA polymerase sigma-70 factor (ECF subfamily)